MKTFAFYLPQFYPTPENDEFWGKGFTEWTNCAKARPLFAGHQQPKIPRDLGFYDLRLEETIAAQASYAKSIGVNGWAIWHYWFGEGKQTLELPTEKIRDNPEIDIDYFLVWVNSDWTKSWVGEDKVTIFKQQYSTESYRKQYEYLRTFFTDSRYEKIDNKPVLTVLDPGKFNCAEYQSMVNAWAVEDGWDGMFWLCPAKSKKNNICHDGFDLCFGYPPGDFWEGTISGPGYGNDGLTKIHYPSYAAAYANFVEERLKLEPRYVPTFLPNWDNTPRYADKGQVFTDASFETLRSFFGRLVELTKSSQLPFLMIKAWNEWAEGNMVEPDIHNGSVVSDAIGSVLIDAKIADNYASPVASSYFEPRTESFSLEGEFETLSIELARLRSVLNQKDLLNADMEQKLQVTLDRLNKIMSSRSYAIAETIAKPVRILRRIPFGK